MSFSFGKALSGGTPITADQARVLEVEHLHALRDHYRARAPLPPSDNVLDQRVAEEIDTVKRQLELVEGELKRRGGGTGPLADRLARAEDTLESLAEIVGADDKCEGVARADDELKRRLNRRSVDGRPSPCENR